MPNKIRSLKDLKSAIKDSALTEGAALSHAGRYAEAVSFFDKVKDFSSLDTKSKSSIRESYYTHGKTLQHRGKLDEALRCFSRAREACPEDILLTERRRLVASRRIYQTSENVTEFRRGFGLGFTPGGYDRYDYPFMEMARDEGMYEKVRMPVLPEAIDAIESVGKYRIQAQGRHLLSYKIREYKGKHPYNSAKPELAGPFAYLLADFIRSETELAGHIDVIVPSPANPENYVGRWFIPALLIGKKLSDCLAIPYRELFSVRPMSGRFRDMPECEAKELIRFKEKRYDKIVSGRQILLLDDVVTTGTTISLFAGLLKSAGATAVYGVTLARTDRQ